MTVEEFMQKLGAMNADALVKVIDTSNGMIFDVKDVEFEHHPDTNTTTLWIKAEES